jgi:hypothetical protein
MPTPSPPLRRSSPRSLSSGSWTNTSGL